MRRPSFVWGQDALLRWSVRCLVHQYLFRGLRPPKRMRRCRCRRDHPGVSTDRPRQWLFLWKHQHVLFLRQLPGHRPNPGYMYGRHVVGPNRSLWECQLSRVARGHHLPVWTALLDCGKRNHRRYVCQQRLRPGTDFSRMCIRTCWMCRECHPQRRRDHYLQPVSPGRLRLARPEPGRIQFLPVLPPVLAVRTS